MLSRSGETTVVTGGAGFLGQRVIARLAAEDCRIRALVRPGADPQKLRAKWPSGTEERIEIVPVSFEDVAGLERAFEDATVVLHVAAAKSGSAASQVASTVVGTDGLLRAAVAAGKPRFVLVSSLGVMGAADLPRGATVDEQVALEPRPEWRDPYTFAKHRQEQLAWKYHRECGLPLVVVRPGVIFGPGQTLLNARVGLVLFGVLLHLGGGNTVPMTFVDSCADAVVRAGRAPGIEGEAFCIVDDDLPTSRHLLRRYRREVRRVPFLPVPWAALRLLAAMNAWYTGRTAGHLPAVFTPYKVRAMWKRQRFSNDKAKRLLGWKPAVPIREALDRTLADELTRLRPR